MSTIEALIDISLCFSLYSVSVSIFFFFMIIPFHMFPQNSFLVFGFRFLFKACCLLFSSMM